MNRNLKVSPALALIPLLAFVGMQQSQTNTNIKIARNTAMVSCWSQDSREFRPASVRSPVLVSPDGTQRAYVTVQAQTHEENRNSGGDLCQNRSALFVAVGPRNHFEKIFSYGSGQGDEQGNGIQLIDWSLDSHVLLADLLIWRYESEAWEHNILIYRTKGRSIKTESLSKVFSESMHMDCGVEAQLVGFLPDGRVALRAMPIDEEEEGASCVRSESLWGVDLSNLKVASIGAKTLVKPNGRFEPPQ